MLKNKIEIIKRHKIDDTRGWFLKIITGKENKLPYYTGEFYAILALPGETRANHYHLLANEWFTLIQGRAILSLEDVETKERLMIEMNSETPITVFVPNTIAHSFRNLSEANPFILLTYTDQFYSPIDTLNYSF